MNGALILVIALMVVGVVAMGYSSYADGKEKERKRAERRKNAKPWKARSMKWKLLSSRGTTTWTRMIQRM